MVVDAGPLILPAVPRRGEPYPIFALQTQRDGVWTDASADHFITQGGRGMAVSIAEVGVYRVQAFAAPWSVAVSMPAETRAPDAVGQYRLSLSETQGQPVQLDETVDGAPLANAPVAIIDLARGLPSLTRVTDAIGRLVLVLASTCLRHASR
mgnify:CR=1 FL=1